MSDPREGAVTEAQVQQGVRSFLLQTGWDVYRVGQYKAKRTQDSGVADMLCFHERYGFAFVECKRPKGGVQSDKQKDFEASCKKAGVRYVLARSVADVLTLVPGARAA